MEAKHLEKLPIMAYKFLVDMDLLKTTHSPEYIVIHVLIEFGKDQMRSIE